MFGFSASELFELQELHTTGVTAAVGTAIQSAVFDSLLSFIIVLFCCIFVAKIDQYAAEKRQQKKIQFKHYSASSLSPRL